MSVSARTCFLAALWVTGLLFLLGCSDNGGGASDGLTNKPDGGPAPAPGVMKVLGTVTTADLAPIAGAEVWLAVDRDRDGQFAAAEGTTTQTDASGKYTIEAAALKGDPALLRVKAAGKATLLRRFSGGPKAVLTLDVSLAELKPLTCSAGKCATDDNTVTLEALPADVKGSARAFNPVTETDKFPGSFRESNGKLLISGGFVAIELTDASGKAVQQLGSPATLRFVFPKDTWAIAVDITPSSDRIEVPLYSFDETRGTWVADGTGYLEDQAGQPIAESELGTIRGGSFSGTIYVRGQVQHLSYWNCDWPIETHGCVTGTVAGADGAPVPGATVFAGGVDYTATFEPVVIGDDRRFCLDVLRSEKADEDLDQNGKKGDQHKIAVYVVHGGQAYTLGHYAAGTAQGSCATSGCVDLGTLALTADKETKKALEGHWAGDWGDMLLKKVGGEFWGAYTHDQGTVVVRQDPDGTFRGWWSEVPSRLPPNDAGEVEFRFAWEQGGLALDGRWRYGVEGAWRENWDLKLTPSPAPSELEARFDTPEAFKRHP